MAETIGRLLSKATTRLAAHDLRFPRDDAEVLLAGLIHRSREYLLTYPEVELSDQTCSTYDEWVNKRTCHYPIQYLTGKQEFYGRQFLITEDVLVPRPETELLIEVALELISKDRPLRIIDVGTGSGCVAITLACELPRSKILASDISREALKVASENRKRHGREEVTLVQCSTVRPVSRNSRWDLVISNPPYVSMEELDIVSPGVLEFEPKEALLAGQSGLEIYRDLFRLTPTLLGSAGYLVVEIGYRQTKKVLDLGHRLGWINHAIHKDLAGIDRCLVFSRP